MIGLDLFLSLVWKNHQNAIYAESSVAMPAWVCNHPESVALRSSNYPIHLNEKRALKS